MSPQHGISVVITTWNGRAHLERHIPSVMDAMSTYQGPWEVIVVDDAGSDDTDTWIASRYPQIRYKRLATNIGNGQTMNRGAELAQYPILYFLDNDVTVSKDFLHPLLPHLDDPTLFAVGSHSSEHPPVSSDPFHVPRVKFQYGIFWYFYDEVPGGPTRPVPALFASFAHCAVSREKFFALGGFDALYGRFYLEDLDICYRAWRRGWKVLVEPRSHVHHQTAGTIGKILSRKQIQRKQWGNRFLFTWKNIHSPALWAQHLFFLVPEVVLLPFIGRSTFSLGFVDALGHVSEALGKRAEARRSARLSDVNVLSLIGPCEPISTTFIPEGSPK